MKKAGWDDVRSEGGGMIFFWSKAPPKKKDHISSRCFVSEFSLAFIVCFIMFCPFRPRVVTWAS